MKLYTLTPKPGSDFHLGVRYLKKIGASFDKEANNWLFRGNLQVLDLTANPSYGYKQVKGERVIVKDIQE